MMKLADDHWEWLHGLLKVVGSDGVSIEVAEYLYKTAMEHGYKHGWVDAVKHYNNKIMTINGEPGLTIKEIQEEFGA